MSIEEAVSQLQRQVRELKAEADCRRVLARYMFVCDVPYPLYEKTLDERLAEIGACFTEDAIWEGVGGAHANQFGRKVGRQAIVDHMRNFYGEVQATMVYNTHYVSMGQLYYSDDGVEGIWPQIQPWIYEDGSSLLRSSRVRVNFRETDDGWKMSHYRTESLFIADLPANWPKSRIERAHLMKSDS